MRVCWCVRAGGVSVIERDRFVVNEVPTLMDVERVPTDHSRL